MKLMYNDTYDILDINMSDSNIGARKAKSVRNHIFVLNGIIHDILANKNAKPVDIEVLDYKQCFDSLWLEECMNDLFETGIDDDNLALVYEANRKINMAVNTPNGITAREYINNIVLQGDVYGPIECSVQVDTFGKECITEDKYLYMYKETVGIPPLAMVDDLVSISHCGLNSVVMNSFLNTKSNVKKLQLGISKCHKLHIGKEKKTCPDLYIDEWRVETVDQTEAGGEVTLKDIQDNEHLIQEVSEERYLGDIISKDGKNNKNIKARISKANGSINQVMSILEEICFGKYFFEVALVLRNSLFINSLIFNSEAWYNITKKDYEELEMADEILLRRILECPAATPKEMLYLEMACLPIRFIIMGRRIMFLHYILNEDSDSLINKFFKAQETNPIKNDWCESVREALKDLNILLTFSQIKLMKKEELKNLVKAACEAAALEYLNKKKAEHSKVLHLSHTSWEMQPYLKPNTMLTEEAKFIFLLRTRMLDVRVNFRNKHKDINCPNCKEHPDDQPHLLTCGKLTDGTSLARPNLLYESIFESDVQKILQVSRLMCTNFKMRKQLQKSPSVTHVNPGNV